MLSRKLLSIAIVGTCLLCAGCLVKGDTFFRVTGVLADEPEQQVNCILGIHSVSSGRRIDYRNVGRSFEESFVLLAKPADYYFEAKCDGRIYRSKSFMFGGKDTFNKTIELGQLHASKAVR